MTGSPAHRHLVLFDGVCALCNRSVRFLLGIDRRKRLLFAPLQGTTARAILERHQVPGELDSLVLVRNHGGDEETLAFRSAAVLGALEIVGGAWRVLSWFRIVPRGLRDGLYDWIAAHRYRWFGRYESCRLPAPGEAERFLD